MTENSMMILAAIFAPVILSALARRAPHTIACLILVGIGLAVAMNGSIIVGPLLWLVAIIVSFVALSSQSRIAREKAMLEEMRKTRQAMERRP